MIPPNIDINPEAEMREESLSEANGSEEDKDSDEPKLSSLGSIVVGIFFVLLGLAISLESVGFGVGFVFLGIIAIVGSYNIWKADTEKQAVQEETADWEKIRTDIEVKEALQARKAVRQTEIDEIVRAVKSTIRVRCTYCGTLNEESAIKCESCGANL